jgi:predicted RNA binding protein with dsRBD fold (UPF0201 family)
MAGRVAVEVVAPVACTESVEKVSQAVSRIFPGLTLRRVEDDLIGESPSLDILERLRMQVRARRIRASARTILMKGVVGDSLIFYIDKQAAYMGRVSFWDPMERHMPRPLMVRVRTDRPLDVVEWLTS